MPELVAALAGADPSPLVPIAAARLELNTRRGYVRALRSYAAFADGRGAPLWPVSPQLAAAFLDASITKQRVTRAAQPVSTFVGAVAWICRLAQQRNPLDSALFGEFRQGLVRDRTSAPRKQTDVVALGPVVAAMTGDPRQLPTADLRVRAVMALYVFALARPDDIACTRRNLVRFDADGSAALTLPNSKSDPGLDGQTLRLRPPTRHVATVDPVAIIRAYFDRTENPALPADRPLFFCGDDPAHGIGAQAASKIGSLFGRAHGLGAAFTARQYRPSVATALLLAGVDPKLVQKLGRWANIQTMLRHYDGSRAGPVADVVLAREDAPAFAAAFGLQAPAQPGPQPTSL